MNRIARLHGALTLALLAGCADQPADVVGPSDGASFSSVATAADGSTIELKRPKVDVTGWADETITVALDVLDPNVAEGMGPGSALLITIPGEGRFGCTANFIWKDGSQLYLGSAGHCFIPAAKKATHGAGSDYDASGVTVMVCVKDCGGNFRTNRLVGTWVDLGKVAYARQTDPTGTDDVGNDFGVVEIPAKVAHWVRPEMPVWGAYGGAKELEFGKYGCHYGNGVGVGEVFLTKARVGLGGGSDDDFWMGDFAAAFGDSGSGLLTCENAGATFRGKAASGVLTHLGFATGEIRYKNQKFRAEHGFVLGTTMRRAVEMAREAGLNLSLVTPS